MPEFNRYTIEEERHLGGGFIVYGHGNYPSNSPYAGQYRRVALEAFETVEQALKKYPDAEESESTKWGA